MSSVLSATRRRLARRGDAGFSLVETMAAMAIALVVFLAVAGVLLSTTKASMLARENQQSIEAASEAIETVRAINFTAVANLTGDLVGDPDITGTAPNYLLDPDGPSGTLPAETVLHVPAGAGVATHRQTFQRNATRFTVSTLVTKPAADSAVATANYRRVTVIVRWTTGSNTRERRTSTIVTSTRRGLPLPKFEWGTSTPISVNASAVVHIPFTLTNRGAPDAWNLTWAVAPAISNTWRNALEWRVDVNGNARYDLGEPLFTDSTDSDTTIDTGLLYTDNTIKGVLAGTVPPLESTGNYDFTLTATSSSQPGAPTAVQFFVDRVTVSAVPCAGCSFTRLYLQNDSSTGNTNTSLKTQMVLTPVAPPSTATTLYNFDTNIDSRPGRRVLSGGTGFADTEPTRSALWSGSVSESTFGPTTGASLIIVQVYARRLDGSAVLPATLSAYVTYQSTGSTYLNGPSGSATSSGLSDWTAVTIAIPVSACATLPTTPCSAANSAFYVGNNKRLEVRLQSSATVEIAYDAFPYPSYIQLPKQ